MFSVAHFGDEATLKEADEVEPAPEIFKVNAWCFTIWVTAAQSHLSELNFCVCVCL